MQIFAKISDATLFLQEWASSPKQIGAIAPSSKGLSSAMASWLPADPEAYVLELGPGTGSVTQALLNRGLRADRLIAIEKSPKMADLLRSRFSKSHVITGDALELESLVKSQIKGLSHVGAVISSLPLLNFEPAIADQLAGNIRTVLQPGGKFIQYSYHIGNKQPKAAAHFTYVASRVVWLNIPPARVSVYQK